MKREIKNYSKAQCLDSIFGKIQYKNNSWAWISFDSARQTMLEKSVHVNNVLCNDLGKGTLSNPIVILVLESPHSAEYENNTPCAANGTSGKNIADHLCDIFNNHGNFKNSSSILQQFLDRNQENTIDVWVVNSVQYQCSMGITPICHIIKEINWIDEWCERKADFQDRVTLLCNRGNFVVINFCTKGKCIPMKEIVEECLISQPNIQGHYCKGPILLPGEIRQRLYNSKRKELQA